MGRTIAENRKARYNYFIEDTMEAGIVLTGTEVKALRQGRANIAESYASPEGDELWLINAHIPEYKAGNRHNHEPTRRRKLLLKRKEIERLAGARNKQGMTLVPLKLYFNDRGLAKLSVGLAKGKKLHDKRATEKDRDWNRQKQRLIQEKG
ncbi:MULTISPECIES: SsrA-binding protein SmpB [unclassified Minwuia]|uniref:SsrA-binding protein SmpB n=1 Tax=unclassified Minwuia TaxID=2618799 RepID=UPI002479ABE7|nr:MULTISPECIES: SsrA-binding protein SmpB [unclassified Minwuia]